MSNIRIRNFKKIHFIYKLLDEEQQALLKNIWQFFYGMGDDHFHVSEQLGDNTLRDFITVDDFGRHDHYSQQKSIKKIYPHYTIEPYPGVLGHSADAELMINGTFHDAVLSMVDRYIEDQRDAQAIKTIGELIPHEYRYPDGVDANGKEAELEELSKRYSEYCTYDLQRLKSAIEALNKKFPKRVYLVNMIGESPKKQGFIYFVFSDNAALKAVRFRHFMSDCQNVLGDNDELEALIQEEKRVVLAFIERAYRDILSGVRRTSSGFR